MRKLVVGIDEAGYGPNLGPLCVGASVWSIPDTQDWTSLADAMSHKFRLENKERQRYSLIPLGDSKKLYHSGGSRLPLSAGVLGLLTLSGQLDQSLEQTMRKVRIGDEATEKLSWYRSKLIDDDLFFHTQEKFDTSVFSDANELLTSLHVQFHGLFITCIDELQFNQKLEVAGNKSTLLTEVSLDLVRQVVDRHLQDDAARAGLEQVEVLCDKHGGRNRYHSSLCHAYPDSWFEIVEESAAISRYRARLWGVDSSWSFQAKGDNIIPCSAASMIAKWMREVQMAKFNAFWREKIATLTPTAGYPVDAKRFANEIDPVAAKLGLKRDDWWRRA